MTVFPVFALMISNFVQGNGQGCGSIIAEIKRERVEMFTQFRSVTFEEDVWKGLDLSGPRLGRRPWGAKELLGVRLCYLSCCHLCDFWALLNAVCLTHRECTIFHLQVQGFRNRAP